MRKKLMVLLAMLMAAVFVFGACGGGSDLVGRWRMPGVMHHDVELEFQSNGSGTYRSGFFTFDFTWRESNGNITFTWGDGVDDDVTRYSISADGSELHLHDTVLGERFAHPFLRLGSD